jgi:putative ABC transport system ATP-binding protein
MDQKFPLIKLNNISKEYKLGETLVKALDGISLQINSGEFISILGKSGSGKSTLMHIIGLLDKPTSGELFFEDTLTSKLSDNRLAKIRSERIGFVFQAFNLLARTSTLDNVLLPTIYFKKSNNHHNEAIDILKRVGLGERLKNTPSQLSGGQQQRVAIARALINDPSIILADEPTGNLDSKSGREILKLLHELHEEGKTVVIVTHDESISSLTDRVIKIIDGKIVEDRYQEPKPISSYE